MLTCPCLTLETRTPHTVLHASTRAQIACDRSETRSVQIAARHVRAVGAASSAREIQGRPFHCADSSSQLVASYNESHRQEWFKSLDCITLSRRKAGPHYFGCVTSQVPIFEIIISCCVSVGYDLSEAPS